MSKRIAILLGDIHFTVGTLELATQAFRQALKTAVDLDLPLVMNGDTLDSKAIIRGECANRLIYLLTEAHAQGVDVHINVGNHDLLTEKGIEHVLNFLKPYANIVEEPTVIHAIKNAVVIPYQNSSEKMQAILNGLPVGSLLIIHQGVMSANMGHYVQDKTSLPPEAYADFRVIASHYHRAQNIKCGRPRKGAIGLFSYLGSPYSLSFAEAGDGPKGFQILSDDGILELVPTNLRKHVIKECDVSEAFNAIPNLNSGDLLWMKVSGPYSELEKLKKKDLGLHHLGHQSFKFDKVYTEVAQLKQKTIALADDALFDKLIDQTDESPDQKAYMKTLWRDVLSANR